VLAGKQHDSEASDLKKSVRTIIVGSDPAKTPLSSLELLDIKSADLLEVNIADILRLAVDPTNVDFFGRPENASTVMQAVSRLAQLTVRASSRPALKSAAMCALSALGNTLTGSALNLESPFSYGYRRIPENPKEAHLTVIPLYVQTLLLLLNMSAEYGSSPVALCARRTIRSILRLAPHIKAELLKRPLRPGQDKLLDLLSKAPIYKGFVPMPADGILLASCLGNSESLGQSRWLVAAFQALAPHTHSIGKLV
jgi:hypothetical protein